MNRRQKLIQQQFLNNEAAIIKRLKQVYGQALKDVNGNIEALMKRFDPETGDLPQSAIYQLQYQNMIKDQLEGILNQMQTKQFTSISDYLDTCYEDGFVGSLFDLHGQDVPLMMPLNQESMVTAVQLDSKISQGLYTRLGEDVGVLKKKITAQVSRSIATGTAFAECAKQLAGYTRIGYNNAIRIVRTEGHRIQNQAAMNVMEQAKERGADIVKQWDATLDGKTRDSHAAVDGEIRELDEKFSNNLMFPGDPSGAAAEVINCRCRALQRARWAVGGGFTKWNNFTRQFETFDAPQDYGEFKKAFFSDGNKRYMDYVQQMEKKYRSRDWMKIMDQMTEREYDRYFDLMSKNPIYNGKSVSVNSGSNVDKIHQRLLDYQAEIADLKARYDALDADINRYYWDPDERRAHGVNRAEQREWKANFDLASAEEEWITLKPQIEDSQEITDLLTKLDNRQRKQMSDSLRQYEVADFAFGDGTADGVHHKGIGMVYKTTDGTEIVYPKGYDVTKQVMTPEQAVDAWMRVPEAVRIRGQHIIEVLDYDNSQDSYWANKYNMPDFHTYMTGGKRLSVYGATYHDDDYRHGSFIHEVGHWIDQSDDGYSSFSDKKLWITAMQKDLKTSGKKSPTAYGEQAGNHEDFAESLMCFYTDRDNFTKDFPERARILKLIMGE